MMIANLRAHRLDVLNLAKIKTAPPDKTIDTAQKIRAQRKITRSNAGTDERGLFPCHGA